jgi:precorrin-2 dehydrogenase/sirohydrochlorin ferrochelatase
MARRQAHGRRQRVLRKKFLPTPIISPSPRLPMFPVFLKLKGRLCVVIGAGPVGRRKIMTLLESAAAVRVVCLENRPGDWHSSCLQWLNEPYTAEHLEGAMLVFAAATAEVNQQVVRDAGSRGVWVNAADDPGNCDFFVPATVRRGDFVVAVGTGGAAPALAHAVRTSLESQFDDAFGRWVALLSELRPIVLATISDAQLRRRVLEQLCHWDWLEQLRREEIGTVRAAMMAKIQVLAGRSVDQV